MANPDQTRILRDRARPLIVDLWWALAPLASVVRFMNTGAHPDDETSSMLAALAFRDGINLSYACSTRGEGGQNDIGQESGADLGALRTREMERACDVLNMRLYWHSETPDDPISDFGFSKSGTETLGIWGHARTLARFVEIIRTDRPDIICPTFLDIPGQHGHHRAMTQAAHEVMTAAADPDFASNLPPWQVRKMYLPAWSGAGQAYDDEVPPPPATLVIDGSGRDPVSGWSWERIGQQSRVFHRTQGMGRWVPADSHRDWPLHLAQSHVAGPDTALAAGLYRDVAALADVPGAEPIAAPLRAAGAAIDRAIAGFAEPDTVAAAAAEALAHVRAALAACPSAARDEVAHRLADKEVQLSQVLRLAHGIEARGQSTETWLTPGDSTPFTSELFAGTAEGVTLAPVLPEDCAVIDGVLSIGENASPSDGYRAAYDPASPPAPALDVSFRAAGQNVRARLPLETPPVILPRHMARLSPVRALLNLSQPGRRLSIQLSDIRPAGATPALQLPAGWQATPTSTGLDVTVPPDAGAGRHTLPLTLDGTPARTVTRIAHEHIDPTARAMPAEIDVALVDVAVPSARIGYIGAGNDRVDHWLRALGADVHALGDDDLARDGALAAYDTLLVGIFAMRFRPGLAEAMARIHAWVNDGGTLVTLYHRPWDNWDPARTPPRRLEIGQPSLRWRVTDQNAKVTPLTDHPLLSTPNSIGPQSWDNWVKERGLYFAKSWDDAYQPLLEMADPGEEPHRGALLVAEIGKGRHVHTSLILHHQMEHLVPGAFALMANLVSPRA